MDDKSIEKTTSALNGYGIALDDPTTALSLPAEHARHDTMDPHWARTCWMVMGQWL